MVELIISIWLLIVICLAFWNIKWGVCLFLVYFILVPVMQFKLGSLQIGYNFFCIFLLIGYFIYAGRIKHKTDLRPFWPFFIYFGLTFVIIPLQSGLPLNNMLNSWRIEIMRTLILPVVMWNVMKSDKSSVYLFRNSILLSIGIAVSYALWLTQLRGFNPYIMSLSDLLGSDMNYYSAYYDAESGGRVFGRISSVFVHPMTYACFLGFAFVYVYSCVSKINRYVSAFLLVILVISAVTCGVRSVLGGLCIVIVYYLLIIRNFKILFWFLFFAIIIYSIIIIMPDLYAYMESIVDFDNSNEAVHGSSLTLRIDQFKGALKIIDDCLWLGKGYGWTLNYVNTRGSHPVCFCFESLIYVIICNWGIVGFLIWGVFSFQVWKYNHKAVGNVRIMLNCMFLFYISYSCITGEYGYMRLFLLFYILILGNSLTKKNEIINDETV